MGGECELQVQALRKGLVSVVPPHVLPLFTWLELELLVCGRPAVDVSLLKTCTVYRGGVDANTPHVKLFWTALEELSVEARRLFLRLVWGQAHLPASPFHTASPA